MGSLTLTPHRVDTSSRCLYHRTQTLSVCNGACSLYDDYSPANLFLYLLGWLCRRIIPVSRGTRPDVPVYGPH